MGTPLACDGSELPLTIFTALHNRVALLRRTFASLAAQTCQDFEWLIVDDGSTEEVSAPLRDWQRDAAFPIVYVRQENRGKHCAHNRALRHARGALFAQLDSDDELVPSAVERLLFHWQNIPPDDRGSFSGVTGLCIDERGVLVGRAFDDHIVDCRFTEAVMLDGVVGEKWGCHRTDVLRSFPFPVIPGERYCPEGLVWNRIARQYQMRHVNEVLRVFHTQGDRVSTTLRHTLMHSAQSARLYYQEALEHPASTWQALKNATNYVRYSLHGQVPWPRIVGESPAPRLTVACSLPGAAIYASDRIAYRH